MSQAILPGKDARSGRGSVRTGRMRMTYIGQRAMTLDQRDFIPGPGPYADLKLER
ncbi:MAG: hypothetical protein Q7T26_00490 [Dehalococcoidia bacterium]|nr:hypothetical protein [Dehalococcoidia bacterium]